MKPKIGDKFIFEIDRIYSSVKHEESRYGIKGFENFVLSENKISQLLKHGNIKPLKEYDEKGWKLTAETYDKIRDEGYRKGYDDAIAKMNNVDPRIYTGDEVIAHEQFGNTRFIAWYVEADEVHGIDEGGGDYLYPIEICRKTGKHFDITFKESEEEDG